MIIDHDEIERDSQLIVDMVNIAYRNVSNGVYDKFAGGNHIEEFCTVKVWLPRSSGHTTAALQLMVEHEDAVLVVPRANMKDLCKRTLYELIPSEFVPAVTRRIYTADVLEALIPIPSPASILIFDNSTFMRKADETADEACQKFRPSLVVKLQ